MPSLQLPNIKIKPSLDEGTKMTSKSTQPLKVDSSNTQNEEFYHIYHNTLHKQQDSHRNSLATCKKEGQNNNSELNKTNDKTTNKTANKTDKNLKHKDIKNDTQKHHTKQKDTTDILTQLINLSFLNNNESKKISEINNKTKKVKIKKKIFLKNANNIKKKKNISTEDSIACITKLVNKKMQIDKKSKLTINTKSNKGLNNSKLNTKQNINKTKDNLEIIKKQTNTDNFFNNIIMSNKINKKGISKSKNRKNNINTNIINKENINIENNINREALKTNKGKIKYKTVKLTSKHIDTKDNNILFSTEHIKRDIRDQNIKEGRQESSQKRKNKTINLSLKKKQENLTFNLNEKNKSDNILYNSNEKLEVNRNKLKNNFNTKHIEHIKNLNKYIDNTNKNINAKTDDNISINYFTQNTVQNTKNIHVNNRSIITQINNFISDNFQNIKLNQNVATLQLHPPELGKIKVKLKITNNLVNATFIADHPDIKQVLEANIQLLRQQLAQGGLQLNNCFVNLNMNSKQFFSDLYKHSSKQNNTTNFDILDDDKSLSEDITKQLNIRYNLFKDGLHLII